MKTRTLFSIALLALWPVSAVQRAAGPLDADLILVNGRVITVDANDRVAQAVAVKDGRIIAVGTTADITRLAGPSTRRIDLHGLTATPGLLDAHAHFSAASVDRMYVLDLSYPRVKSIRDVKETIAARVRRAKPGEWIEGAGWDEGKLDERRYITAADLDAVAPDNPVWLSQTMGHYGVANSAALRMAGISAATQDPARGTIDRAADGRPTGVLKESAQGLVRRLVPGATREQRVTAMKDLVRAFNAEGMTGVKDPAINLGQWETYQEVLRQDSLNVRVFVLWVAGKTLEAAQQLLERVGPFTKPYLSTGDDHLISGGIKMYVDGSGGARTAWLYDDWNRNRDSVDTGNRGYPATDPDILRQQIRLFTDAGLHVSIHSIGDRGIDWVVDSYKLALDANHRQGLRLGIIHSNIPTDHAIDVMAELQKKYDAGYPEPSATFMWWIGDTYAGNFGPQRSQRLNPFHTYLSKGMIWANGSDFGVTPFPARYALYAAVTRRTLLGVYGPTPFGTAEAIDIHSALRAVTIWAAHQMFLEQKIGSIEAGKYADIAVWDRDIYSATPEQIRDMQCQLTLFHGRVVYQRPGSAVTITGR